jgi:hypothetical protein
MSASATSTAAHDEATRAQQRAIMARLAFQLFALSVVLIPDAVSYFVRTPSRTTDFLWKCESWISAMIWFSNLRVRDGIKSIPLVRRAVVACAAKCQCCCDPVLDETELVTRERIASKSAKSAKSPPSHATRGTSNGVDSNAAAHGAESAAATDEPAQSHEEASTVDPSDWAAQAVLADRPRTFASVVDADADADADPVQPRSVRMLSPASITAVAADVGGASHSSVQIQIQVPVQHDQADREAIKI